MSILVEWGNEAKTYTVFKFVGKWTWEEYHQSISEAYELVKDCPYTVNILLDITECHLFPQNLLSNASSTLKLAPRETDIIVVVTTSHFIEALLRTLEIGERPPQPPQGGGARARHGVEHAHLDVRHERHAHDQGIAPRAVEIVQ